MKKLILKALSSLHPLFRTIDTVTGRGGKDANRRRDDRIVLATEVKVRMMGKEIVAAECKNISSGGMCMVFDTPPPGAGTGTVWLSREYAGDYLKFESSFRKIWAKPENPGSQRTMMGVVFQDLVPEQRDRLYMIIKREKNAPSSR